MGNFRYFYHFLFFKVLLENFDRKNAINFCSFPMQKKKASASALKIFLYALFLFEKEKKNFAILLFFFLSLAQQKSLKLSVKPR